MSTKKRNVTLACFCLAAAPLLNAVEFAAPVPLKADGKVIQIESPGFAAPCWADVNGDGHKDLLVGQFHEGKIKVYRNLGDGALSQGEWLKTDGRVAKVPGVW
jgi:hypothetical protein